VRSRQVLSLVIDSLVLKKKIECERKKKGTPVRVYRQKGTGIGGAL
jgi:hypothetical protein